MWRIHSKGPCSHCWQALLLKWKTKIFSSLSPKWLNLNFLRCFFVTALLRCNSPATQFIPWKQCSIFLDIYRGSHTLLSTIFKHFIFLNATFFFFLNNRREINITQNWAKAEEIPWFHWLGWISSLPCSPLFTSRRQLPGYHHPEYCFMPAFLSWQFPCCYFAVLTARDILSHWCAIIYSLRWIFCFLIPKS